jgi:hypothetical protein
LQCVGMYEMPCTDNPTGTIPSNTVRGEGNIERDAPEMRLNNLSETGVFPFGPVQMVRHRLTVFPFAPVQMVGHRLTVFPFGPVQIVGHRLALFPTYQFRRLFVCVIFSRNGK